MKRLPVCLVVVLTALLAIPAFAADRVIYNGVDLWRTIADGSTHADFSKTPIPAGFFCNKSEPFTGRIGFKGVPVATSIPGALEKTDTIVQRLDDAVFNKKGVAQTRLQVRSLNSRASRRSRRPAAEFIAKVSLDGEQPITRMRIIRENASGGRFLAPISVNVKICSRRSAGCRPSRWRSGRACGSHRFRTSVGRAPAQSGNKVQGFLLVDTDGDRIPDTYLPGTSNFGVGQMRRSKVETCRLADCHLEDDCMHCVC